MMNLGRWWIGLAMALGTAAFAGAAPEGGVWSTNRANEWYRQRGWLVGCNFSPSSAINQLEMWQADTFDLPTIDRELGWAGQLGFNSVRVFLHDLLWKQDREDFLKRLDQFLATAQRHRIGVMFVLLDACWDPFPKLGKQREPRPHVHNSGWVQSPGRDILCNPDRHEELKEYIQGVVGRFAKDPRVDVWDVFNEPDNVNRPAYFAHEYGNKAEYSLTLIRKAFSWARALQPTQPLTAGVWMGDWSTPQKLSAIDAFMLEQSDLITFHNYAGVDEMKQRIGWLRRYQRPVICTEYMARPAGSTFDPVLGVLKAENVGAYNWGFVAGKTQTIYPWDSWTRTYTAEPPVWFHDIFHRDGTPYRAEEARYIKQLTGRAP